MRGMGVGLCALAWGACSTDPESSTVRFKGRAFSVSEAQSRILGCESAADWLGADGTSSQSSEGAASVRLDVNGWTTMDSGPDHDRC